MITLLHGEKIEASRDALNRLIAEASGKEIRRIDGTAATDDVLIQALESTSLFDGSSMVVVERLFGKLGRQQKRIEKLAGMLRSAPADTDIVLWEDRELSASALKQLGSGVSVRLFPLPKILFQFLDQIGLQPAHAMLATFARLMETEPAELVFVMIARRMRQLLELTYGNQPAGTAPWQISKLKTQAHAFSLDKLKKAYRGLLDAEFAIKSGTSPFQLQQLLEQWIISLTDET